jgi:hypothetical protein
MFELKFSTANEAFDCPATEIARILRSLAAKIQNGELPEGTDDGFGEAIRDINGNTVGHWRITP